MRRLVESLLAIGVCAFASSADATTATRWVNGKWFDGTSFVSREFYTADGVLMETPPSGVEHEAIDLQGRYVVPALADAHHHGIDQEDGLDAKISAFLRDGIFYVKNRNVIPDLLTPALRTRINHPRSIDVVFSNGGLTASGQHPAPLHASLAEKGIFPGLTAQDMENRAYFFVDTPQDVELSGRGSWKAGRTSSRPT